jgi:hypothetical protein
VRRDRQRYHIKQEGTSMVALAVMIPILVVAAPVPTARREGIAAARAVNGCHPIFVESDGAARWK